MSVDERIAAASAERMARSRCSGDHGPVTRAVSPHQVGEGGSGLAPTACACTRACLPSSCPQRTNLERASFDGALLVIAVKSERAVPGHLGTEEVTDVAEPIVFEHSCGAEFHPLTVCAACRAPYRAGDLTVSGGTHPVDATL